MPANGVSEWWSGDPGTWSRPGARRVCVAKEVSRLRSQEQKSRRKAGEEIQRRSGN